MSQHSVPKVGALARLRARNSRSSFENLCEDIRENADRPSEHKVRLPYSDDVLPPDAGRLFGEALQSNDYVFELDDLDLLRLFPVDEDGSTENNNSSRAPFLSFIRNSASLRKINIRNIKGGSTIYSDFFAAMAHNNNIEELILSGEFTSSSEAFALLMQSTKSLKVLTMNDVHFADMTTFGAISQAIATNTSLVKLSLSKAFASTAMYANNYLPRILRDLRTSPGLHTLCLNGSDSITDPSQMLLVLSFLTSTNTLQHLSLTQFKFERKAMTHLLSGLHNNHSVDEMSFLNCKFNKESTNLLIDYMQNDRRLSFHSISKLRVSYDSDTFAEMKMERVARSIVMKPPHVRDSSIGSSLRALYLTECSHNTMTRTDLSDFLHELALNGPSKCPLESLHLQRVANKCMAILPKCVSRMDSLMDLNISAAWGSRETGNEMVDVLRQHGNIRTVSVLQRFEPYFNKLQSALVDAYCQRNVVLPTIVGKPQMTTGVDDECGPRDWSLFPILFRAAMQARTTGPRNVLIGLRALEDSIGPHRQGKRKL